MIQKIVPLLFLIAVACQSQDDSTFRFASSGEFRPFSYLDETGTLQGYDIDVGRELAKRLDRQPEPVMYRFAGIVEGVKTGRFHAAVASHTITEERAQHVAFTLPYYYSGPQVFTRVGQEFENIEEIRGLEIAVSRGSTYVEIASEWSDKISIYDSDIVALEALNRGRHRLVITDSIAGAQAMERGLTLSPGHSLGESRQAIAVSLENRELLENINQQLAAMQADGTLRALSEKHFGRDISVPMEDQVDL